jgi:uncharacterized protein (DUF433 family)
LALYNSGMDRPIADEPLPVIAEHIVATSGICGGKPRIAGHRITVQNIVIWHEVAGRTPDEIVAEHPGITLADVHAALAYYWDHVAEIRADMEAAERVAEEVRQDYRSVVDEKLRQRNAEPGASASG